MFGYKYIQMLSSFEGEGKKDYVTLTKLFMTAILRLNINVRTKEPLCDIGGIKRAPLAQLKAIKPINQLRTKEQ